MRKRFLELSIFNVVLMSLVLLRSAGYFQPYFPLSVNLIFLVSLLISMPLFKAKSTHFFLVALIFWIFACVLYLLHISIWAERTAVYTYQSFVIGLASLVYERIKYRYMKQKG
jgi:hypothetical protein